MKRLVLFTAACAGALALTASIGAAGAGDLFTGVWVGVESPVGDGSTDFMTISGPNVNGTRTWRYYETDASGYCGGGALSAEGAATSGDELLTVTVVATRCFNGSAGAIVPPFQLTMTATGMGRIDWGGVIFNRVGAK